MSKVDSGVEVEPSLALGPVSKDCRPIVVGIDFGTSYSGVAFSYKAIPDSIKCSAPTALDLLQTKVPTALLELPDGSWEFGNAAEVAYNDILMTTEPGEQPAGQLYKRFKMMLMDKRTDDFDSILAISISGKPQKLMVLISMALKFLKDHALAQLSVGFGGDVDPLRDVQWVLTVPAIWNDFGKAFMRKAAFKAGLIEEEQSDNLLLVLEPEGASLAVHVGAASFGIMQNGSRFMVLDCGGGTVDITVHEVLSVQPLTMKTIAAPTGGAWGGDYVNMEFKKFLAELLGPDLFKEQDLPLEFYSIYSDFDKVKVMYDPSTSSAAVRVNQLLETKNQLTELASAFNAKHPDKSIVCSPALSRGFLTMSKELMLSFFEPYLLATVDETRRVMKETPGIRHIMVVGGFGSSKVLTARIRAEFHNRGGVKVIVPENPKPQGAIVHGAVYFGLHKDIIQTRVHTPVRNRVEKVREDDAEGMAAGLDPCSGLTEDNYLDPTLPAGLSAGQKSGSAKESSKVAVVGLHFGHFWSGIAFAFYAQPEIITFGAPTARNPNQDRVPTSLLRHYDGRWEFGNAAEDRSRELWAAASLRGPYEQPACALHQGFLMQLKGKSYGFDYAAPMDYFAKVLTFLEDYAILRLEEIWRGKINPVRDVQWVLTVPAIWNDFGMAFMRKAAFKAGLIEEEQSDNLLLVLEPEGAALAVHMGAPQQPSLFGDTNRFLVLDCGQRYVCTTAHEVVTVQPFLTRIFAVPCFDDEQHGSEGVTWAFYAFVSERLGIKLAEVPNDRRKNLRDMWQDFEDVKVGFRPDGILQSIRLVGILDKNSQLVDLAAAYNLKHPEKPILMIPSLRDGFLTMSKELMLSFFEPSLRGIVYNVRMQLQNVPDIGAIVLVGGYGSSKVLTTRIRAEFHNQGGVKVIILEDPMPQRASLLGAVHFGLRTNGK